MRVLFCWGGAAGRAQPRAMTLTSSPECLYADFMNGEHGQGRALTVLRELLGAGCGRGKLAGGPGASGSSGSSLCRAPRRWGHQEGIELDGK